MKSRKLPLCISAILLASACGCGLGLGGPTWDPSTVKGSFATVESAFEDIKSQLAPPKKKGRAPQDLGSDSDRFGLYLGVFMKSTEGTPVHEDAKDFSKKFNELERLVSSRAPLEKQQAAMKEVEDSMAAIKAKL